jgi:predicted nucleotidyltransferase
MKPSITTNTQSNDYSFKQMQEVLKQYFSQIQLTYRVKSLGIFGSFVREEATESSDLDILVEF